MPLKIEKVPLDTLVEDAGNVRKHPKRNLEAIAGSLKRFGQAEPLVVQAKTRKVIGGNGRLEAMKRLGWAEAEIVRVDVDDRTARALGLALNRTAETASWDDGGLAELLKGFDDPALLSDIGWDDRELAEALTRAGRAEVEQDEVPEPPKVAVTKLGDVWELGRHRVVCGDACAERTKAAAVAGQAPRLLVTDPPYGVEYDPEWRNNQTLGAVGAARCVERITNDDRVDWSTALRGEVAYVWGAGLFADQAAASLRGLGFDIRSQIVWVKPYAQVSRGHYHWQHETCWYAVRHGATAKWAGDRKQSTIWCIAPPGDPYGNGESREGGHPTQKPVECMARPIRNHNGNVFDPFLGSGTTLVAAEQLDRTCYGIELEPRYVDVTVERWEKLTGGKAKRKRA